MRGRPLESFRGTGGEGGVASGWASRANVPAPVRNFLSSGKGPCLLCTATKLSGTHLLVQLSVEVASKAVAYGCRLLLPLKTQGTRSANEKELTGILQDLAQLQLLSCNVLLSDECGLLKGCCR